MKKKIIYKNFIDKKYLNIQLNINYFEKLKEIIVNLDNTKDSFHSLSKKFKFSFEIKDLKEFKKYKYVVIIGMGGSILGAEAIYNFLEKKIKKKFFFLDNIDEVKLFKTRKKINKKNTLYIIISKSGFTAETLSNFALLKHYNNFRKKPESSLPTIKKNEFFSH